MFFCINIQKIVLSINYFKKNYKYFGTFFFLLKLNFFNSKFAGKFLIFAKVPKWSSSFILLSWGVPEGSEVSTGILLCLISEKAKSLFLSCFKESQSFSWLWLLKLKLLTLNFEVYG